MIRDVWIISFASGDYIEYARGLQASQALPRGQYYVKLNFVNISSNPDGCVQFVFKI